MRVEKNTSENSPKDSLGDLLAQDAARNPVEESPWFSTRTVAAATSLSQNDSFVLFRLRSIRLRWLLPIPLAGFAAFAFVLLQHETSNNATITSSDADFEDHIELVISGDSSQDYLVSQ